MLVLKDGGVADRLQGHLSPLEELEGEEQEHDRYCSERPVLAARAPWSIGKRAVNLQ